MSMRETSGEAAFTEWRRDPTPARLAALLTSVQDRVYTICLQILRRPEDAEDACQEILMEVAKGAGSIDEPRPFKVWLYRVAVHTALDRRDAIARQARLARSAPAAEGPAMNETERAELMRAIGKLDDRTRCMVIEHYFDKATFEEIAAREGVSAVAIWKRLERARESLRNALLGAGFTIGTASVAQALEAVTPAAAPAGLIGKIALTGGIAMGTKATITAGPILVALILLGASTGGGYLVGGTIARRDPPPEPPAPISKADPPVPSPKAPIPVEPSEPPAPAPPPPTDWDAVAKEALDLALDVRRSRIPLSLLQVIESHRRLGESTGPWFVKSCRDALAKYLKNETIPMYQEMASEEFSESLALAAVSGGPAVTEYILERFQASDRTDSETVVFALTFLGSRRDHFLLSRALDELPGRLMASSKEWEWKAGLGLAGRIDSDASRKILLAALDHNDSTIRFYASSGLVRVGDRACLETLKRKQGYQDAIQMLETRLAR